MDSVIMKIPVISHTSYIIVPLHREYVPGSTYDNYYLWAQTWVLKSVSE
jgi:hypothetical protein